MKTESVKKIVLGSIFFAGLTIANVCTARANTALDFIEIEVNQVPDPIVEDQVLCGPGAVSLQVLNASAQDEFKWFDGNGVLLEGETESFLEIANLEGSKQFGVRSITTSGVSRMVWVSVTVAEIPATPGIILQEDPNLCEGEVIELRSTFEENNLWSTGETTQSIFVSESGSYSVKQLNEFCESPASELVNVVVNAIPTAPIVSASGPLSFCDGEFVVLSSSYEEGNLWSNGATSQSIMVSNTGTYSVFVVKNGCESPFSEEITTEVHELPAMPEISLIGANPFCEGSGVRLVSSVSDNFIWSTGETSNAIIVTEPGVYYLTAYNENCEVNSVDFIVDEFLLPAPLYITESSGGVLQSSYVNGNQWYKDNQAINGANNATYLPTEDGDYHTKIIFDNGCAFESQTLTVVMPEVPDVTLSQQDFTLSKVSIYPNPAKNYIRIDGLVNAAIMIYDITGRVVVNVQGFTSEKDLDISHLKSGVYMVSIEDGIAKTTKRFIVK